MEGRHDKRNQYLKRLLSTHLRSSELQRYVDLPARLEGRTILDIGAGTSTTSMDFAGRGATFVALDLRFRHLEEVSTSSTEYFEGYRLNLADPALKQRHPMLESVYETDKADSARFFSDFAGKSRGIYVAGDFWHLPFADHSFDYVVSVRCLSDCFVDADMFLEGACEALRVAKPGSTVQISPWQADYLSLGRRLPIGASEEQQEHIVQLLRSRGIRCQTRRVRDSDVQCLQLSG